MTGSGSTLVVFGKPNKNMRVYNEWEPAVAKEGDYILSHDPISQDEWTKILVTKVNEISGEMVAEWHKSVGIPKVYPEDWDFYHPKKEKDDRKD